MKRASRLGQQLRGVSVSLSTLLYVGSACILVGMLLAPLSSPSPEEHGPATANSSQHSTHHHSMHEHTALEVTSSRIPKVNVKVVPDSNSGWNLSLDLEHFQLTPERVNQANIDNTGHAHLYINGEKIARLYGQHFHITHLASGPNQIMVSLNANDHSQLVHNGTPLQSSTTIINP